MNPKFKLVQLVAAASFSSLLWAGCATEQTHCSDRTTESEPIDLINSRSDTHPELKSGLGQYAGENETADHPVIEEAAGVQP